MFLTWSSCLSPYACLCTDGSFRWANLSFSLAFIKILNFCSPIAKRMKFAFSNNTWELVCALDLLSITCLMPVLWPLVPPAPELLRSPLPLSHRSLLRIFEVVFLTLSTHAMPVPCAPALGTVSCVWFLAFLPHLPARPLPVWMVFFTPDPSAQHDALRLALSRELMSRSESVEKGEEGEKTAFCGKERWNPSTRPAVCS